MVTAIPGGPGEIATYQCKACGRKTANKANALRHFFCGDKLRHTRDKAAPSSIKKSTVTCEITTPVLILDPPPPPRKKSAEDCVAQIWLYPEELRRSDWPAHYCADEEKTNTSPSAKTRYVSAFETEEGPPTERIKKIWLAARERNCKRVDTNKWSFFNFLFH